jgi:hypothetical protein
MEPQMNADARSLLETKIKHWRGDPDESARKAVPDLGFGLHRRSSASICGSNVLWTLP